MFYIFLQIFRQEWEKTHHHIERGDEGIPSSCPKFATSTIRQASSWMLQILDTRMGFPHASLNGMLDSINLIECFNEDSLSIPYREREEGERDPTKSYDLANLVKARDIVKHVYKV